MGVKVNIVILCPDWDTAAAIIAEAPIGLLSVPPALQSTDGRYAWIHWNWPDGFVAMCESHGATAFQDAPDWKAQHGWVDKPPPDPPEEP